MLAAPLRAIFNADSGEVARCPVGDALERLRKPLPKVADLLAFYVFPADHWPRLRSTNRLERVNREIGRRTDVVGIFPNDRSLIRLAASVVIEQNDECLLGRRYLSAPSLKAVLDQEKRDQGQRGDPRAHRGLSNRQSCRRVIPVRGLDSQPLRTASLAARVRT
jgi:putative transposase